MTEPVAGPAGAALVDGAAGVLYSAPFLLAAAALATVPAGVATEALSYLREGGPANLGQLAPGYVHVHHH